MRAAFLLGLLLPASFTFGQATYRTASTDGVPHTRVEGINIPSIPNAPFTAKVQVTWDQPLVGGGTVSRMYYTTVARDTQGRVRREIRDFIPANSNSRPPLRSFTVYDPVSATRTTCVEATLSCTLAAFTPAPAPVALDSSAKNPNLQPLGQQTMNALTVVGTRETATSTAGTGGNSRVVVSHKDSWYSPDLQMDLSVVRTDPQMGKIALTVTDLLRGEPDTALLSVPGGYTVVDGRGNQSMPQ